MPTHNRCLLLLLFINRVIGQLFNRHFILLLLASSSAETIGLKSGVRSGLAPPTNPCARCIARKTTATSFELLPLKPKATKYLSGPVTRELMGFTMLTSLKRRV